MIEVHVPGRPIRIKEVKAGDLIVASSSDDRVLALIVQPAFSEEDGEGDRLAVVLQSSDDSEMHVVPLDELSREGIVRLQGRFAVHLPGVDLRNPTSSKKGRVAVSIEGKTGILMPWGNGQIDLLCFNGGIEKKVRPSEMTIYPKWELEQVLPGSDTRTLLKIDTSEV